MIAAEMRSYSFSTIGYLDDYGQEQTTQNIGVIKIAIYINAQNTADNIKYKDASYIGFTQDKTIDDSYIINYGNEKLKVLYVNPKGRYKQVFLKEML